MILNRGFRSSNNLRTHFLSIYYFFWGVVTFFSFSGKFSNKKLMFTGGFKKMSRSEAKIVVENNGGKVLGSISKKLVF